VGTIADRIGPRRVALPGLIAVAICIGLIGLSGPSIASWYAAWALYAFLQCWAGNMIWASGVVSRFDRNRGLALALMLMVQAVNTGLMPSFGVFAIATMGWRSIFFAFAGYVLLIGLPLAWGFFYGAGDLERRAGRVPVPIDPANRTSIRTALGQRQFWQIAIAFATAATAASSLLIHLQPVLTDAGLSPVQAAAIALILAPSAIAGRLLSGFLLDRLPANLVAGSLIVLPAFSHLILLSGGTSPLPAYLCAMFVGIAAGAESDLLAYLVSRYFGRDSFGGVYALLLGTYAIGYGLAPVAAGAVYDATGSYRPIFIVLAGAAVAGAALIYALGRPRSGGTGVSLH
jgi:predicted MFS family arabinose efflux permease